MANLSILKIYGGIDCASGILWWDSPTKIKYDEVKTGNLVFLQKRSSTVIVILWKVLWKLAFINTYSKLANIWLVGNWNIFGISTLLKKWKMVKCFLLETVILQRHSYPEFGNLRLKLVFFQVDLIGLKDINKTISCLYYEDIVRYHWSYISWTNTVVSHQETL